MARKLRTGFELPFSNATGSDQSKSINLSDYFNIINGFISIVETSQNMALSQPVTGNSFNVNFNTVARTKTNNTRGCILNGSTAINRYNYLIDIDVSAFSSGFYENKWIYLPDATDSLRYFQQLYFNDGTDYYHTYIKYNGSTHDIVIRKNGSTLASGTVSLSSATWYNVTHSLTNTGDLTITVNGVSVNNNTSVTFSNIQQLACGASAYSSAEDRTNTYIDDLSINDGSGASDNGLPASIRGYNFFDPVTVYTNSGFTAVGGSTVLANLQDGSDSTRVSASADLSYIDFSLPTLSGTGMSETAANFTKIEAINVYGRQIEATKASSLLKAKVTDTVAVVNREENLSLPLTVGNDSVTMFDDGSSDWVLANLDSGDMDFRVTFDKP